MTNTMMTMGDSADSMRSSGVGMGLHHCSKLRHRSQTFVPPLHHWPAATLRLCSSKDMAGHIFFQVPAFTSMTKERCSIQWLSEDIRSELFSWNLMPTPTIIAPLNSLLWPLWGVRDTQLLCRPPGGQFERHWIEVTWQTFNYFFWPCHVARGILFPDHGWNLGTWR